MTTSTTSTTLDPRTYARGLACVHCGLCLPACPTYTQTFNEADSPRGRIQLMLALSDGAIQPTQSVMKHLDLCLDCRACETACPSGVVYHELIEETRQRNKSESNRFLHWMFFNVLVHPARLKFALLPARILQRLRLSSLFRLLPARLQKMQQMMPASGLIWPKRLPERVDSTTTARKSVGLLAGCIGSVLFDQTNRKAVELLTASGAEVHVPRNQDCCGAIHHHNGAHDGASERAKRNVDAFLPVNGKPVDVITTTIAGCGAMLREYGALLRDDPKYATRASEFSSKVRDISEVLLELALPEMEHPVNETVTYHDACHLLHAQGVGVAPRALLSKIPGLKIVPLPESDICCGAAGTYNLTQPEMASDLADRKLRNIASTGASICVTGNVGCAMHIQSRANARAQGLCVVHTVDLLHRAVFGDTERPGC